MRKLPPPLKSGKLKKLLTAEWSIYVASPSEGPISIEFHQFFQFSQFSQFIKITYFQGVGYFFAEN